MSYFGKEAADLRSRQLNPCDHLFWKSRGYAERPINWRELLADMDYYYDEDDYDEFDDYDDDYDEFFEEDDEYENEEDDEDEFDDEWGEDEEFDEEWSEMDEDEGDWDDSDDDYDEDYDEESSEDDDYAPANNGNIVTHQMNNQTQNIAPLPVIQPVNPPALSRPTFASVTASSSKCNCDSTTTNAKIYVKDVVYLTASAA